MKVLKDKVLIKLEKPDNKTAGGIILLDQKQNLLKGLIVSIGKDVSIVKVNDKVMFYDFESISVKIDNKDCRLISESKLLAVITD